MRFLANENSPGDAVIPLQAAGRDVLWVRKTSPGASDREVLAWAAREERILMTFDKDFGELPKGAGLPRACVGVRLRLPTPRAREVGPRLAKLTTERDDWAGHFSVIEPGRVRMRPLA
jgi:predicted nuclease of predicted toxin-antitoxin system